MAKTKSSAKKQAAGLEKKIPPAKGKGAFGFPGQADGKRSLCGLRRRQPGLGRTGVDSYGYRFDNYANSEMSIVVLQTFPIISEKRPQSSASHRDGADVILPDYQNSSTWWTRTTDTGPRWVLAGSKDLASESTPWYWLNTRPVLWFEN